MEGVQTGSVGNFRLSPAADVLLPPGDYSSQMQRLAATTAS